MKHLLFLLDIIYIYIYAAIYMYIHGKDGSIMDKSAKYGTCDDPPGILR